MATDALIVRGTTAYRSGQRDEARKLFAEALVADPEGELGWL